MVSIAQNSMRFMRCVDLGKTTGSSCRASAGLRAVLALAGSLDLRCRWLAWSDVLQGKLIERAASGHSCDVGVQRVWDHRPCVAVDSDPNVSRLGTDRRR